MTRRFYIGIPTQRMDTVYAAQRNTQWCWAAAIEIILRYYGVAISQEAIVYRAYGLDWRGQPPNREATYEAMAKNLNDWGIDFKGEMFIVRASFHWGAPPPAVLLRELSAQRPVLLSYISRTFPRLAGHAVVATAVQVEQPHPQAPPRLLTVVVRDPWPSRKALQSRGRLEYPARRFLAKITSYWLVTAQKQSHHLGVSQV